MTAESARVLLLEEQFMPARPSRLRAAGRIARANPVGVAALLVLLVLIFAAIFASAIAPYGETQLGVGRGMQGPSSTNILGTDRLGRDIFSRMLYGSRLSLYVGFAAVTLGTVIGSVIGLVSGYLRGTIDLIAQRLMDVMMSVPVLLLALVVASAFGPGTNNTMLAVSLVFIPGAARVVRSVTLSLSERQFVEAARAAGASTPRIAFRHILPTALDEILVLASLGLGAAIIVEAALSFVGGGQLGTQPPHASWGSMLSDGRNSYTAAPHMVYVPAAFISVTVLAVNILGDTVRDILDPKVRGAHGRVQL
jgi:ABC-type dipeptide/oligopeptide/nickel transport system permease subunit